MYPYQRRLCVASIFLKNISDSFEKMLLHLTSGKGDDTGGAPEDNDEYKAGNVFFVPLEARWSFLLSQAKQPTIGKSDEDAMDAFEKENPILTMSFLRVVSR